MDCFKTDFGERIPTDVQWFDGSDPQKMHNHYAYIYNELVWNVLKETVGVEEAVLFARSASVGATVPGALGRRLLRQLRIDGGKPARRAVHRPVRVWLESAILADSRIPRRRMSTSGGAHSACSPATAACTVANPTGFRGPMTTSPVTWCASSLNRSAG